MQIPKGLKEKRKEKKDPNQNLRCVRTRTGRPLSK